MADPLLKLRCPCCKKPIEVDTRTGRARALSTAERGLDDLIDAHKVESERLGDLFDSAREQHGREGDRLDDLFRKARDETKGDEGKPPRPIDFD